MSDMEARDLCNYERSKLAIHAISSPRAKCVSDLRKPKYKGPDRYLLDPSWDGLTASSDRYLPQYSFLERALPCIVQ